MSKQLNLSILVVALLMSALLPGLFGSRAYAATSIARTPSCGYWSTDVDRTLSYVGKTLAGHSATYNWDLSIGSFRDCTTGGYLGKTADKVCLTVPPFTGWPNLKLYNQWYTNNSYVNENSPVFTVSNTSSTTFCAYSGSWLTPAGGTATVVAFAIPFDGSYPAGTQYVSDVNVG